MTGSGQGGAITLADIEAAAAKAARAPAEKARRGFDPAAMRKAIASAMARSKREIPHYYLGLPIDMARATEWLAAENARRDVEKRLLAGVLLLKATALALKDVPELNGFWIDDQPKLSVGIHVGWAISLRGGGLMAPAIHDADARTIDELMAALRDLVIRARTARLRGSEMTDPTVTVTSLGERGAERVYGVIYPPQLAIVGLRCASPGAGAGRRQGRGAADGLRDPERRPSGERRRQRKPPARRHRQPPAGAGGPMSEVEIDGSAARDPE